MKFQIRFQRFIIPLVFIIIFVLLDALLLSYLLKHYESVEKNPTTIYTMFSLIIGYSVIVWSINRLLYPSFPPQRKILDLIAYGNMLYIIFFISFSVLKTNKRILMACIVITAIEIIYKLGLLIYAWWFVQFSNFWNKTLFWRVDFPTRLVNRNITYNLNSIKPHITSHTSSSNQNNNNNDDDDNDNDDNDITNNNYSYFSDHIGSWQYRDENDVIGGMTKSHMKIPK